MKKNKIKLAGEIKSNPTMILDAPEFACKKFETKIAVERKSGVDDVLILQFEGTAMEEKDFERLTVGAKILVNGEIHTEHEREIAPDKPNVKIFVAADEIQIPEKFENRLNRVKIYGCICREPRNRLTAKGKDIAEIMIAVKGRNEISFIPCIGWNGVADTVKAKVKKGMYVEVEGRFQSRQYKKVLTEGAALYLMTAYEVAISKLKVEEKNEEK